MDFLYPQHAIEIPILVLIKNLGLGLVLATALSALIQKSTRLPVDTSQYLPLFLILIPTMILIITVIKTSIALSLGLVGALSIVRFRTPVKEPEELAYIFVAIAIGLGLGANQAIATIVAFSIVSIVFFPTMYRRSRKEKKGARDVFLDIKFPALSGKSISIENVAEILESEKLRYRFKRIEESERFTGITVQVPNLSISSYDQIRESLRRLDPGIELAMIDNARIIT
jgi:hypothetical protein